MNEILWSGFILAIIMLCLTVLPFMLFSSPTNLDEIKDQYFEQSQNKDDEIEKESQLFNAKAL